MHRSRLLGSEQKGYFTKIDRPDICENYLITSLHLVQNQNIDG